MSLRLDRLLTLYFFSPLARLFPPRKGIRIPILMYHSISDDPETGHPYFWINTSPARFAEHMKFLYDNDYKVISLSEAVELIKRNAQQSLALNSELRTRNSQQSLLLNPQLATRNSHHSLTRNSQLATRNPVVLTFDDGYQDFYTQAFPVLKKYGFTATLFLPTDYIDNGRPGLRGKEHLTWDDVRELAAEGHTFGSHTRTHSQLCGLETQEVEAEIRKSKEAIEDKTGRAVELFCHPYRFPEENRGFVRTLRSLLEKAGYTSCATTRIGCAGSQVDEFFIPRVPMSEGDEPKLFRAKLQGGFDWLYMVQKTSKKLTWRRLHG